MAFLKVGQTVYGFIYVRDLEKAQGTETGSEWNGGSNGLGEGVWSAGVSWVWNCN